MTGVEAGSDAWAFARSALAIFGVNIVLSGDNGVLIAMAAAKLPRQQKFRAIAIGAGISVIFQVAAAFFAFKVLHVRFVQLAGGLLIFWISIGLFRNGEGNKAAVVGNQGFLKVIWFILVADLTMSTDNILAVAAIANGSIPLLCLGLGLSIVVLVFASSFLSLVIEKYPLITFAGAAILGNVAANMLMTDAFTTEVSKAEPSGSIFCPGGRGDWGGGCRIYDSAEAKLRSQLRHVPEPATALSGRPWPFDMTVTLRRLRL